MQLQKNFVGYLKLDSNLSAIDIEETLYIYLGRLSAQITVSIQNRNVHNTDSLLTSMNLSVGLLCRLKGGDDVIFLKNSFPFCEDEIEILRSFNYPLAYFPDYKRLEMNMDM
jgi:hypothetical protein